MISLSLDCFVKVQFDFFSQSAKVPLLMAMKCTSVVNTITCLMVDIDMYQNIAEAFYSL